MNLPRIAISPTHRAQRANLNSLESLESKVKDLALANKSLSNLDYKVSCLLSKHLDRFNERDILEAILKAQSIDEVVQLTQQAIFEVNAEQQPTTDALASNSQTINTNSLIKALGTVSLQSKQLRIYPYEFNHSIVSRLSLECIIRLLPKSEDINVDVERAFDLTKDIFDLIHDDLPVLSIGLELLCDISGSLRNKRFALLRLIFDAISHYSAANSNDEKSSSDSATASVTKDSKVEDDEDHDMNSCDMSEIENQTVNDNQSRSLQTPIHHDSSLNSSSSRIDQEEDQHSPTNSIATSEGRDINIVLTTEVVVKSSEPPSNIVKKAWKGTQGAIGMKKIVTNLNETSQLQVVNNTRSTTNTLKPILQIMPESFPLENISDNKNEPLATLVPEKNENKIQYKNTRNSLASIAQPTQAIDSYESSSMIKLKEQSIAATSLVLSLAAMLKTIVQNQKNKDAFIQLQFPDKISEIAIAKFPRKPRAQEYFMLLMDSVYGIDLQTIKLKKESDICFDGGLYDMREAFQLRRAKTSKKDSQLTSTSPLEVEPLIKPKRQSKLGQNKNLIPTDTVIIATAMVGGNFDISSHERDIALRWLLRWSKLDKDDKWKKHFLDLVVQGCECNDI